MFEILTRGKSNKTEDFLQQMLKRRYLANLESYGEQGVRALEQATPKDTGQTARSWHYRIIRSYKFPGIEWYNDEAADDGKTPVVILIQYGHATRGGDYIQGRDFINPTMEPLFDRFADDIWRRVAHG
jgi:hypothetical protein